METKQGFPIARLIVTFVVTVVFGAISFMWSRALTMLQGIVAARQINDDSVEGNMLAFWFRNSDLIGLLIVGVFIVILAWIWWAWFKKALSNSMFVALLLLGGSLMLTSACMTTRATTESERSSLQDIVDVKPNQTAFVIHTIAGSLSGQQQFESITYLESRKVASKRIILDKDNVGGKYLPKNFVILVYRTPVARQWTKERDTGTTSANEAVGCESNESIEVNFQISMAAAVEEANTATYLYYFPTTKLQDTQVNGVYASTALDTIVDNQVRQYLTQTIGEECSKRTLRKIIEDKAFMVRTGEKAAIDYFRKQGITLAYIGLGGQLLLEPEIQKIINDMFIAQQQQEIAKVRATTTAIDAQAARQALILKGEGDAQALAALFNALGKDAASLGPALESYRWNGSRLTVTLAPDTKPSVALPVPTTVPTAQPAPSATPKK